MQRRASVGASLRRINMSGDNMSKHLSASMTSLKKRHLGQGMTEYIIIVALIAVAAIGVYSFFGSTIRHQTAGMAQEMSGKGASSEQSQAQSAASSASSAAAKKQNLGTYGNQQ